jgi:Aspartate oxidase
MSNFDVIIIGAGVSGLNTALNLSPNLSVLVICKRSLSLSNSALAQGGIAAVTGQDPSDSTKIHIEDTLVAGGHTNNRDNLYILANSGKEAIDDIVNLGVNFDKKKFGFDLALEGGHSKKRIHHHQDSTGKELVDKLIKAVLSKENIHILTNTLAADTTKTSDGFALTAIEGDRLVRYGCSSLVIATGGIGRIYEYTTNSAIATGDGITLAHEIGADIKDISLVQFHPTAFVGRHVRECFLISEAVRGAGAYLRNANGERFMERYDERLELAPRDIVSHSIIEEQQRVGDKRFYLDITHKDAEFVRGEFPMIYETLLHEGLDLTKDQIPIYPCQHYLMGGIAVDENALSSVHGLYAVGECACNGVHGNNRLASNSLLEALVFSKRCAKSISSRYSRNISSKCSEAELKQNGGKAVASGTRTRIRSIMQSACFVMPNRVKAAEGFAEVKEILDDLRSGGYTITPRYVEAKSLATIAYLILSEVLA